METKTCLLAPHSLVQTPIHAALSEHLRTICSVTEMTCDRIDAGLPNGSEAEFASIVSLIPVSRADPALQFPFNRCVTIVPLASDGAERPDAWWQQFQTHQFLSFSRKLHEQLLRAGLASAHFQYFSPPPVTSGQSRGTQSRAAVLWEQYGSTHESILLAARQCHALGLAALHVERARNDLDASCRENLAAAIRGRLALSFSNSQPTVHSHGVTGGIHDDRFACVIMPCISMANVPVLSEAMAAGRVVLAPDASPACDYVGHMSSGILYDPATPLALPHIAADEWANLAQGASHRARLGYARWIADGERLASIIAGDGRRWSASDRSADFGNTIRRRASDAARRSVRG